MMTPNEMNDVTIQAFRQVEARLHEPAQQVWNTAGEVVAVASASVVKPDGEKYKRLLVKIQATGIAAIVLEPELARTLAILLQEEADKVEAA